MDGWMDGWIFQQVTFVNNFRIAGLSTYNIHEPKGIERNSFTLKAPNKNCNR